VGQKVNARLEEMNIIDIEKNEMFRNELKRLGFIKKGSWFVKKNQNIIQQIAFPYATQGEKQTRYYSCNIAFSYPLVDEVAKKMDVIIIQAGCQLGYVMPKRMFTEWKISASYSEKKRNGILHDFIRSIEKYGIPILEKYPTMKHFIAAEEKGLFSTHLLYDMKWSPIIYRLLGDENSAQYYIQKALRAKAMKDQKGTNLKVLELIEKREYESIDNYTNDRGILCYINFVKKFEESKDDSMWTNN
jgi:hypothetical protein